MARTYIVVENTPGYLPESDPAEFTSRRDAEQHAVSLARELRADGYRVSGSARDGRYDAVRPEYADTTYGDLGRVVEIIEIEE